MLSLAKNLFFPLFVWFFVGLGICWIGGCLGFEKNGFWAVYFRHVGLGSLVWLWGFVLIFGWLIRFISFCFLFLVLGWFWGFNFEVLGSGGFVVMVVGKLCVVVGWFWGFILVVLGGDHCLWQRWLFGGRWPLPTRLD